MQIVSLRDICMDTQSLFSKKNTKTYFKMSFAEILPIMLSINTIENSTLCDRKHLWINKTWSSTW